LIHIRAFQRGATIVKLSRLRGTNSEPMSAYVLNAIEQPRASSMVGCPTGSPIEQHTCSVDAMMSPSVVGAMMWRQCV